jgi:hypothetical protein
MENGVLWWVHVGSFALAALVVAAMVVDCKALRRWWRSRTVDKAVHGPLSDREAGMDRCNCGRCELYQTAEHDV